MSDSSDVNNQAAVHSSIPRIECRYRTCESSRNQRVHTPDAAL